MAAPVEPSVPAVEFTNINKYILLSTPPASAAAAAKPTDPTTIVLCQWMGASPRSRALQAAFQQYRRLYPGARILTIRSVAEWFQTTAMATRRQLLQPAVPALQADPAAPAPRVLVHLFSNGGGLAWHDVCCAYRQAVGAPLPFQALVLDSSPGNPTVMETWAAMKVGLPKGVVWWPAAGAVWSVIGAYWVYSRLLGFNTMVDTMREGLNDGDVVNPHAARLYIYSKADQLIGAKDVEKHAQEAKEAGAAVTLLTEEDTPHVQHMILDRERYWKKVVELWDSTRA